MYCHRPFNRNVFKNHNARKVGTYVSRSGRNIFKFDMADMGASRYGFITVRFEIESR